MELDVDLAPLPPTLERVVTEADADTPRNVAMAKFEERRAAGLGRFITRAQLLRTVLAVGMAGAERTERAPGKKATVAAARAATALAGGSRSRP